MNDHMLLMRVEALAIENNGQRDRLMRLTKLIAERDQRILQLLEEMRGIERFIENARQQLNASHNAEANKAAMHAQGGIAASSPANAADVVRQRRPSFEDELRNSLDQTKEQANAYG